MRAFALLPASLLALFFSTPLLAADPTEHGLQGRQIDVRLSIADPCLNSLHADLAACSGHLTQRTSDITEQIHTHTRNGEVVHISPAVSYIVRTTDFY